MSLHHFPRKLIDVPPVTVTANTEFGCPVCSKCWSEHCACSVASIEAAFARRDRDRINQITAEVDAMHALCREEEMARG